MMRTMNLLAHLDIDDDDGNADDGGSQETSSSEEEEEDETGDDSEQTNPLLGQIRDRVNGGLSAFWNVWPCILIRKPHFFIIVC